MKTLRFKISSLAFLVAVIVTAASGASAQQMKDAPTEKLAAQTTGQAIDFEFTDLSGKPHKFSEYRGKIVLLDFWATWCAPCLADIPKLKAIYEKHKADGFEIVGLNVETIGDDGGETPDAATAKENAAGIKRIITTRKVDWTMATTETSVPVATKMFGVESLPAKILIDKDGKIIAAVGEKDNLSAIVEKLIAARK